jgi:glycosyltransferase involved in cell wall biosynthesis
LFCAIRAAAVNAALVSVLLATYNGENFISKSIESILNQSFQEFEILIGFNGTTDNSRMIVSQYNDPRIRVFDYGDDKGKSKTLNKLLLESKYEWIAIQDDDDIWINTKLEKQLPYIENNDVIGTFIQYIDINDKPIGGPVLSTQDSEIKKISLSGGNQVANTSTIFKKVDALEIGGWRDGLDGIEDYDFWLRLMRNGKKFINVSEQLVLHRLHSNSNFNTKQFDLSKIL